MSDIVNGQDVYECIKIKLALVNTLLPVHKSSERSFPSWYLLQLDNQSLIISFSKECRVTTEARPDLPQTVHHLLSTNTVFHQVSIPSANQTQILPFETKGKMLPFFNCSESLCAKKKSEQNKWNNKQINIDYFPYKRILFSVLSRFRRKSKTHKPKAKRGK